MLLLALPNLSFVQQGTLQSGCYIPFRPHGFEQRYMYSASNKSLESLATVG